MFKVFPFPAILFNDRLEVIEASPAAYELFHVPHTGEDEATLAGKLSHALERFPDLIEAAGASSLRLNRPGQTDRFDWSAVDRHFEATVYIPENENFGTYYGLIFTEKTARILAQQGGARIHSYLEGIMNSLYLGVMVAGRDMRVTQINQAQTDFLARHNNSLSALDAVGISLLELLPDESELIQEAAAAVLDRGETRAGIVITAGEPSDLVYYSIGFSPIRDEKGEINGLIRICEDITEKKRVEDELRKTEVQARETEVIKELIVTLNHEINNALTKIICHSDLLLMISAQASQEEIDEAATNINVAAERIKIVTEKLGTLKTVKTTKYLDDGTIMIDVESSLPSSL